MKTGFVKNLSERLISIICALAVIVGIAVIVPPPQKAYAAYSDLYQDLKLNTTSDPEGMAANINKNPMLKSKAEFMPITELTIHGDSDNTGYIDHSLYGHDRPPGSDIFNYLHSSSQGSMLGSTSSKILAIKSVPVCLDGSGKKNSVVSYYVRRNNNTLEFILVARTATSKGFNYVSKNSGGVVYSDVLGNFWPNGAIDNYLGIAAADFDGDGIDEIVAVAKTEILLFKNDGKGYNSTNWTQSVMGANVANSASTHRPIVYAVGDFDEDGKDDLAWTFSRLTRVGRDSNSDNSGQAVVKRILGKDVRFTGSNDSRVKDLSYSTDAKGFYAAGITYDDIDGDGQKELVLGGLIKDKEKTTNSPKYQKGFGYKKWNADINDFQSDTAIFEDTNSGSFGIDSARVPMNIAVGRLGGVTGVPYVLMGNKIYKYDQGSYVVFNDLSSLDSSYFSNSKSTLLIVQSGNMYGFNSSDTGKNFTDQFIIMAYNHSSDYGLTSRRRLFYVRNAKGLVDPASSDLTRSRIDNTTYYAADFCLPNTNNDTMIFEYKGHEKAYSDPEVFAAMASPPYFKDFDNTGDGAASRSSTTSFSTISSNEESHTVSSSLSVGGYVGFSQDISVFGVKIASVEAETSFKQSLSYEFTTTRATTTTNNYACSVGYNTVILYTVPFSVYQYDVYVPNNDGTAYEKTQSSILRPYTPMLVSISLNEYDALYEKYKPENALPDLSTVFTHDYSKPGTYLTEAQAKAKNGNFGLTFKPITTNTGTSQGTTLEISTGNSHQVSTETSLDFRFGAGVGGVKVGVLGGISAGYGYTKSSTSGRVYSTTMYGMPEGVSSFGYGFSWALVQYYEKPTGFAEFPVVTYATRDVSTNPRLPEDFRAESADGKVTLRWTASTDTSVGEYKIYRSESKGTDNGLIGLYTLVQTVTGRTASSWTDGTVASGKTYYYKIQSVKTSGVNRESLLSASVAVNALTTPVTKVSLDRTEAKLSQMRKLALNATAEPSNATNKKIIWESSNSNMAIVDQSGVVTPVNTGNVVITAKSESNPLAYAQCIVTVIPPDLQDKINDATGGTAANPVTIDLGGNTVTLTDTILISDTSHSPNAARHVRLINGTVTRGVSLMANDMFSIPAGSSLMLDTGATVNGNGVTASGSMIVVDGTLIMQAGAAVKNFNKNNGFGGGVYVRDSGIFNMSGGTVTNNSTSASGGGLNLNGVTATATISGTAAITGNTALNGGGINLNAGTLNLNGGSITGNYASSNATGIYYYGGTLNISGAPKIGSPDDDNAIRRRNTLTVIGISGSLEPGAYISVEPVAGDAIGTEIVAKTVGDVTPAELSRFFYLGNFNCSENGTKIVLKELPLEMEIIDNSAAVTLNHNMQNTDVFIIAFYDGSGKLLQINIYKTNVTVDIPAGSEKVKAMLWTGMETMEPLYPAKTMIKEGDDWKPVID